MKFIAFIESRLAEPITAVDVCGQIVLFGSISGYFGVFNIQTQKVAYSNYCEDELIREVRIFDKNGYIMVGDEKILRISLSDPTEVVKINFEQFRHSEAFCTNTFSMVGSRRGDELKSLLLYFPTPDSEKMSKLNRTGSC